MKLVLKALIARGLEVQTALLGMAVLLDTCVRMSLEGMESNDEMGRIGKRRDVRRLIWSDVMGWLQKMKSPTESGL